MVTVGMIIPFYGTGSDIPSGFEPCDGKRFTLGQYPALYNLLIRSGNTDLLKNDPTRPYSQQNNALPPGVIRVPDLRAEFIRGFYGDTDPVNDPPKQLKDPSQRRRGLGSVEADTLERHEHDFQYPLQVYQGPGGQYRSAGAPGEDNNLWLRTKGTYVGGQDAGVETRPRNMALMFVICARSASKVRYRLEPDPRGPIPEDLLREAARNDPNLEIPERP